MYFIVKHLAAILNSESRGGLGRKCGLRGGRQTEKKKEGGGNGLLLAVIFFLEFGSKLERSRLSTQPLPVPFDSSQLLTFSTAKHTNEL